MAIQRVGVWVPSGKLKFSENFDWWQFRGLPHICGFVSLSVCMDVVLSQNCTVQQSPLLELSSDLSSAWAEFSILPRSICIHQFYDQQLSSAIFLAIGEFSNLPRSLQTDLRLISSPQLELNSAIFPSRTEFSNLPRLCPGLAKLAKNHTLIPF